MIKIPITINSNSELEFSNKVKLRKISKQEFRDFFDIEKIEFVNGLPKSIKKIGTPYFYSHWNSYYKLNHTGKELIDSIIPEYLIEHQDRDELEKSIICLRLLTNINFYGPIGFDQSSIHFFDCSFTSKNLLNLNSENLDEINNLISNFTNNDKLNLLIERFKNVINVDLSKKIRLVESVSIIESIVSGNDKDELRFRFSLFSSFLTNKYNFKEIRELYDIRSQLVHTGKSKKFNEEKLEKAFFLCKEILKKFIIENLNGEKIFEAITEKLKTKHSRVGKGESHP